MVDFLIIRSKFDLATTYTNWIGDGLKAHLTGKGHTVTDLSDSGATPQNVAHWLNNTDKRTKKAVIALGHGNEQNFFGEKNNAIASVISSSNTGNLSNGLHVYTLACSTNADNGIGHKSVNGGCFSWLGYVVPVYAQKSQAFKDCIWTYITAMADGKTIEQCEEALRKAYESNPNNMVFAYNLKRLLLRKKEANMTINSHNREKKKPHKCDAYRQYALRYYKLFKETNQRKYLCIYYYFMAAYMRCLYTYSKNHIYVCYYYRYLAAFYGCHYCQNKSKLNLCNYYRNMIYFYRCMYLQTRNKGHLTMLTRFVSYYRRYRC